MTSNALPRAETHYNALKKRFKIPKVKKGESMTDHKARKEEVFNHKSKKNIHTKSKNNISMSSTAPSELAYKVVMKQPIQRVWEPKMTRAQKIRSGQFKYDTRQLPKSILKKSVVQLSTKISISRNCASSCDKEDMRILW